MIEWHGTKAPVMLAECTPPGGAQHVVDEGFQGVAVRSAFQRGRMPVDQFFKGDSRFLEPIGVSPQDMIRPAELGYYRTDEQSAPKKLTSLAQEMAARVVGAQVLSPREGDRVVTWNFTDGGIPGRLIVLCKDGLLMSEERGRGDGRPELLVSEADCVSTGDLRTTNRTREQSRAQTGPAHQESLFGSTIRPLPTPTTPEREMRNFLLGR